jgi:putative methionine-R-sulfoxide reductase with GAF domain
LFDKNNKIFGLMDIDSVDYDMFDEIDKENLIVINNLLSLYSDFE